MQYSAQAQHSRSSKFTDCGTNRKCVTVDVTYYWWSKATLVLACTILGIQQLWGWKSQCFLTPVTKFFL